MKTKSTKAKKYYTVQFREDDPVWRPCLDPECGPVRFTALAKAKDFVRRQQSATLVDLHRFRIVRVKVERTYIYP